jgi:hypothetical protein
MYSRAQVANRRGGALSTVAKPFFYVADSRPAVGTVRWADRVGQGIWTSPRDALVADLISEVQRGLVSGFHRAADTARAVLGQFITLPVIWLSPPGLGELSEPAFRTVVLISLAPALLAVLSLAIGARDVLVTERR